MVFWKLERRGGGELKKEEAGLELARSIFEISGDRKPATYNSIKDIYLAYRR